MSAWVKSVACDRCRSSVRVRFTPESGQTADVSACPLCAKSGLMHCSKEDPYSITLSAIASGFVRGYFEAERLGLLPDSG